MSRSKMGIQLADGHIMPAIGLGTWKSEKSKVYEAVEVAITCGYRHLDCATMYGNEEEIGCAIQAKISDGTVTREEIFVTGKVWNTDHEPNKVEAACRESLKKLGLSYIDLYLMHWPVALQHGGDMLPVADDGSILLSDQDYLDTWTAMEALVDNGLVRSIGVSNFNSEQIVRLCKAAKRKPVCNQIECHPYLSNAKLIEFCKMRHIVTTAYSPLGSSDNPFVSRTPDELLVNDPVLRELGKKYNKTAAQVALRWNLQRGVSVIPKSVTPSRIKENFDITDFDIEEKDMELISGLNKNYRTCAAPILAKSKYFPFNIEF